MAELSTEPTSSSCCSTDAQAIAASRRRSPPVAGRTPPAAAAAAQPARPRHPRDRSRALRRGRPHGRRAVRSPSCGGSIALAEADEAGSSSARPCTTARRPRAPPTRPGASLGCGVPTAVADLHAGETVLDLGSGAGADVLISARRVGASGRAIGLDMTDEMLELARANAADAGVDNVEFLQGYLEDIPLPDDSVDVVISNCVINLAADKPSCSPRPRGCCAPAGASPSPTSSPTPTWTRPRAPTWRVDRLHRRRADRGQFRAASPTPASSESRSARPTASTSTPARRSSAPRKP